MVTFTAPDPERTPSPDIGNFPPSPSTPSAPKKNIHQCDLAICPHFPRSPGRLGLHQNGVNHLVGHEEPGKRIHWSFAPSPEGDFWTYWKRLPDSAWEARFVWKDPVRYPIYARKLAVEAGGGDLQEQDVRDVCKILRSPYLVNLIDWDGFGEDQPEVRKEVGWEICNAGTLNRLMLEWNDGLPESFIWHTMLSLLRAIHHLAYGHLNAWMFTQVAEEQKARVQQMTSEERRVMERASGWRPILHNQINPANIFYCHPVNRPSDRPAAYGKCKLGNFSRAVVLPQEVFDPTQGGRMVVPSLSVQQMYEKDIEGELYGYRAPELSSYQGRSPDLIDDRMISRSDALTDGQTVGTLSDLWSIGAVVVRMMAKQSIWDLVMRENIKLGMMSRRRSHDNNTVWPLDRWERLNVLLGGDPSASKFENVLPGVYSRELREFVTWLIHPNPMGRYTVPIALEEAERLFGVMKGRKKGTDEEWEWEAEGVPNANMDWTDSEAD